jgi:uncharacterized protein (TIGR00255 family)
MTGFARNQGAILHYGWIWELRSVNAKGQDIRFRLPPDCPLNEADLRSHLTAHLQRGTFHIHLDVRRAERAPTAVINHALLADVIAAIAPLAEQHGLAKPSLDALLQVRGIVEVADPKETAEDRERLSAALLQGFKGAVAELVSAREREGLALQQILLNRISAMRSLVEQAEQSPGRSPEAIRARLETQVRLLVDSNTALEPQRLHQEAVLMAVKADIREELDRLAAHLRSGEQMLASGGAVGRRLDFLSQEVSREVNTLCAKSNDLSLTGIGLELKTLVEQFREQVQNVE